MSNTPIDSESSSHKHLGTILQKDGKWKENMAAIIAKAKRRNDVTRSNINKLDRRSLERLYLNYVRPVMEYAVEVWDNCTQEEKNQLEGIQKEAERNMATTAVSTPNNSNPSCAK